MENIKKLTIRYNRDVVGYLAEIEENRIAFQYDEMWLKNGFSISPFSLPLSNEIYFSRKEHFQGLFGVFYDSLPDGWGELLMKRMLAKKGINYDRLSALTKLALISENGLGGLTYEPCIAESTKDSNADFDAIAEDVFNIFENENAAGDDLDRVFALGGSSGGARPKAHIRIDGEEWIVKFPCRIDPSDMGKKEFFANHMAQQCGICINEFKLFPSRKCKGYFGSKRFDRSKNKRIHMVSLAALLETTHRIPNLDYLHLFQVIQNICVDKSDLYEAYLRMAFNVLYGNKDDHGKNFSFLYDENLKGYKLSPAYDLTMTTYKPEHEMTVNGSVMPNEKNLLEVASIMKLSMKKCESLINRVKETLAARCDD